MVVFLCTDGVAVYMGKRTGVAAKLKEHIEHLLAIHCVAHRLELGMVDSIKEHPRLKKLQEVLHFLHQQYHYSLKALRELRMLAEALEEKVLKPVFVAHFEDRVSPERTPQPSPAVMGGANKILCYLKSHANVHFMHFLLDPLDMLKTLSLQFQQDKLTR
ncbi:hypothetical protein SKAU_G00353480 [Synaphobranchus kaupii]|uniref:Uncharacterized protein n=1 Tax=Synaphobranchus kaupii TaxID=118154 RepID=A0A9Q1EKZ1_SYNKA|nr:hypothetical protein SKAU_G00353480 [Synaphobranchus kaupii]